MMRNEMNRYSENPQVRDTYEFMDENFWDIQ